MLVILLAAVLPISFGLWVFSIIVNNVGYMGHPDVWAPISPWRFFWATLLPLLIARNGLKKKSLDMSGAVLGMFVGFVMTLSNYCFFAALLAFFYSSSKATKFRAEKKKRLEDDFKEGGQRNWVQVLCNGGVACELALIYMIEHGMGERAIDFTKLYLSSWQGMAVLGCLACSCGDTWASEIGSVLGWGQPRLITTLAIVPRGTNGGMSIVGTVASGIGGATVGLAYYIGLVLMLSDTQLLLCPPQWPVILVGTAGGLLGSLIDSLLGATFQYSGYSQTKQCVVDKPGRDVQYISGTPFLDNHSVNLISGLITGLLTPSIAFQIYKYVLHS